jgi:hypothetical protein
VAATAWVIPFESKSVPAPDVPSHDMSSRRFQLTNSRQFDAYRHACVIMSACSHVRAVTGTNIEVVTPDGGLVALVRGARARQLDIHLGNHRGGAKRVQLCEVRLERGLGREAARRRGDVRLEADRETVVRHSRVRVDVRKQLEHARRLRIIAARAVLRT